jgi:hypothetical protein
MRGRRGDAGRSLIPGLAAVISCNAGSMKQPRCWRDRCGRFQPMSPQPQALASCYAHMDRLDDARAILEHLRVNGSPVIPPPNILFRNPDQSGFFLVGRRRAGGEPI